MMIVDASGVEAMEDLRVGAEGRVRDPNEEFVQRPKKPGLWYGDPTCDRRLGYNKLYSWPRIQDDDAKRESRMREEAEKMAGFHDVPLTGVDRDGNIKFIVRPDGETHYHISKQGYCVPHVDVTESVKRLPKKEWEFLKARGLAKVEEGRWLAKYQPEGEWEQYWVVNQPESYFQPLGNESDLKEEEREDVDTA